jgi:hypothetical protein
MEKMIHYHGMPITPATAAVSAVSAGHGFVSFQHPDQLGVAAEVCQSFAVDNGAFSAWKSGNPRTDWIDFYEWALMCKKMPNCDFAVIPDVIDGTEDDNNELIHQWPLGKFFGAPVWHMHESITRLTWLERTFHRVCIGSSGQFADIGGPDWWGRMAEAMNAVCPDGYPMCKLHGLRMLDPDVFTKLPFSSADSTNIGRNIGIDNNWRNGNYPPPTKEARAMVMRQRIESHNAAQKWTKQPIQETLI